MLFTIIASMDVGLGLSEPILGWKVRQGDTTDRRTLIVIQYYCNLQRQENWKFSCYEKPNVSGIIPGSTLCIELPDKYSVYSLFWETRDQRFLH